MSTEFQMREGRANRSFQRLQTLAHTLRRMATVKSAPKITLHCMTLRLR